MRLDEVMLSVEWILCGKKKVRGGERIKEREKRIRERGSTSEATEKEKEKREH